MNRAAQTLALYWQRGSRKPVYVARDRQGDPVSWSTSRADCVKRAPMAATVKREILPC